MKNKLKTKPKNTNRYLKGLSLAEMDDVEEAVEYALENPGGTFTAVSQEHSARLSAMNKTVKSISGDTKYIRKAVDKFDKKLDDLTRLVEDNSGTSSGLPVVPGPMRGSPKARPRIRTGNRPNIKPNVRTKATRAGMGLGGMLSSALLAFGVASTIGTPLKEVDDEMLEKFWSFKGGKPREAPAVKPKNSILGRITYQQNIQQNISQGLKELTPSERAIIIRDRLKGMTQIPGMQTGGFAGNHMQVEGIPNARGSLGQPSWGPGRPAGGVPPGSTGQASAAISNGGIEGTKDGGRTGKQNNINAPGSLEGKKGLARNQQEAYNALRAEGLSPSAAKIMVANLTGESLRNPADVHADPSRRNPGQKAHGIASWDDARSARIAKQFGKSPEQMTVTEQSKALAWEMKNHYKSAWADLNNEQLPTNERLHSVIKKFEAPADPHGATVTRMDHLNNLKVTDGVQVAVGASAIHTAKTQVAGTTKPGEIGQMGPTAVVENQGTNAKVRKKPIQPELTAVLDYAAKQAGVDKVEVFSGGQAGKGEGGPRTGSTRHDHGKAGDVYLWKDGKKVNMETAEGREIMKKFATASRQAGATGIGAGRGYMGPEAMHVGFGKEATWGGADWLADAAAQGKALPPVNAMALMQEQKKASETVVASNNAPIPKSLMKNKPVPAKPISVAEKVRSDRSTEGLSERAKSYAMNDDKFPNPDRKFPERTTQTAELSATPNRDAHFAKIDAAIAAQKAAKKVALMTPAPLPLTPAETAGKGDFDRRTGQERLQADRSTDGLMERANAYAMYDDIKNPPRAFPTRQTDQPLPEHVVRPMAATVTPPAQTDMLQVAQDMAQAAIDKAKEAAKMVTDYVKSSSDSAPPAANRIPRTSKNQPPLTNPPRSFHRATKTTNPTQKTPGSDSSKTFDSTKEDPSLWQYPAIEMGVP